MKFAYPVDNEQIFLPKFLSSIIDYKYGDNNYSEDMWEEIEIDETEGEVELIQSFIVDKAIFLSKFLNNYIENYYVYKELADVFFETVACNSDLREGPVTLIDPICGRNNYLCNFEFKLEDLNSSYTLKCETKESVKGLEILPYFSPSLEKTIDKVCSRHNIFYSNYHKYCFYIASYCVVYAIFDYLTEHPKKTLKTKYHTIRYDEYDNKTFTVERIISE